MLVDRVERLEVQRFNTRTGPRTITEGANNGRINSILVFSVRSVSNGKGDIISRERAIRANGLSMVGEFVGRQSICFVNADNSDTSELLGGDTGDDSLVLSKLLSTNGRSNVR